MSSCGMSPETDSRSVGQSYIKVCFIVWSFEVELEFGLMTQTIHPVSRTKPPSLLQKKQWTKADIKIGARVNFRLELRGESGGPVLGFLAVDDISYVNCDHGTSLEFSFL